MVSKPLSIDTIRTKSFIRPNEVIVAQHSKLIDQQCHVTGGYPTPICKNIERQPSSPVHLNRTDQATATATATISFIWSRLANSNSNPPKSIAFQIKVLTKKKTPQKVTQNWTNRQLFINCRKNLVNHSVGVLFSRGFKLIMEKCD